MNQIRPIHLSISHTTTLYQCYEEPKIKRELYIAVYTPSDRSVDHRFFDATIAEAAAIERLLISWPEDQNEIEPVAMRFDAFMPKVAAWLRQAAIKLAEITGEPLKVDAHQLEEVQE